MLPRSVDTLSSYGTDVVHVADRSGRRTLLAAPRVGDSHGTLGPGESLKSQVTPGSWTLKLSATRARTYDVRATLAGLGRTWAPCRVEADGKRVPFAFHPHKRTMRFSANAAADGVVTVTACR
jgi:hypothetical protein